MPLTTKAIGIHQSDVIIRSAMQIALADLRANPWLLDYVFASLGDDTITQRDYGQKTIDAAKAWFLKTQIHIINTPALDEAQWPCISITLVDSSEVPNETTLGDVHSEPSEDNNLTWPILEANYSVTSYTPSTGIVRFARAPSNSIRLAPGMFLVDAVGTSHEILDVIDPQTAQIREGTVADFKRATLKGQRPAWTTSIESASYRETYRLALKVQSEPEHLLWLHSVVVFCLLRYKQVLLEARGFERSVLQSSDFTREEVFESELVFSRYVTVSGYVRHYWPKAVSRKIDLVELETIKVIEGGTIESAGVNPDDQLWTGDEDDVDRDDDE